MNKKQAKPAKDKNFKTLNAKQTVRFRIVDDRSVYTGKVTVSPILLISSYIKIYIKTLFKICAEFYKHQHSLREFEKALPKNPNFPLVLWISGKKMYISFRIDGNLSTVATALRSAAHALEATQTYNENKKACKCKK